MQPRNRSPRTCAIFLLDPLAEDRDVAQPLATSDGQLFDFQPESVCQRCGHRDNADPNAAIVIAQRGIKKLLAEEPLTKAHKTTRIFRHTRAGAVRIRT